MPNHLEQVVRPSQSPQIRPGTATQLLETPKVPENEPQVWGSSGTSVFDLQASAQQELPEPKFEAQRTYDVVKVYDPNDRDTFLETEQMTEYQGRNKISADRFVLRFAKPENTENTEVTSRNNVRKQST